MNLIKAIYEKIPVASVQIGEKEKEFINDCLNTSWIGQGGYVKEFEEKFSAYSNCKQQHHKWNNSFAFSLCNFRY